jgi:hypothetical protein
MTDKELMTEIELRSDDEVSTLVEGSRGLKRYRDRFNQQALDTYRERHQGEEPEPDPMKDRETFEKEKKNWRESMVLCRELALDPDRVEQFVDLGSDEADSKIRDMAEWKTNLVDSATTKTKDEILKDHTRTPRLSDISTATTDEYIVENPENFPPDIVDGATRREIAKESEKRSLRHILGGR